MDDGGGGRGGGVNPDSTVYSRRDDNLFLLSFDARQGQTVNIHIIKYPTLSKSEQSTKGLHLLLDKNVCREKQNTAAAGGTTDGQTGRQTDG